MAVERAGHGLLGRRSFLQTGAAAVALPPSLARAATAGAADPVVETASGRVRGYVDGRVKVFKGVRYGAPTGGDSRFMPPRRPAPWAGIIDARLYGPRAPQGPEGAIPEVRIALGKEPTSEDCLFLNVWTPALNGARPVLVWLHGGGFASGSGSMSWFEGENLAARQDVVLVTINHRLNVFGHLYLGELSGERYPDSGNVGLLDCVAALEWVRDNIAGFGGDPRKVTIFGQSGGAQKVSTLMGMPAAAGLFHRAMAMSGSALRPGVANDTESATRGARALLARLQIAPTEMEKLRLVPQEQLVAAWLTEREAARGPVVDGRSYPSPSFNPAAPSYTADVPFLTGSNNTEVTFQASTPLGPMDAQALMTRLKQYTGGDEGEVANIIATYRGGRPNIDNTYLFQLAASNYQYTVEGEWQAERKTALARAPAYVYRLTQETSVRGGLLRTPHTLDIPYFFDNLAKGASLAGAGNQALADRMSATLAAFARTGEPSGGGLPSWPAYSAGQRAVMVLGSDSGVVNDPRREERIAVAELKRRHPSATTAA